MFMKKLFLLVGFSAFLSACSQNQNDFEVSSQSCSSCSAGNVGVISSVTVSAIPLVTTNLNLENTESIPTKNYRSFLSIINSALEYNHRISSLPSVIEQRRAEAEIIHKNNYPTIQPVARYYSRTTPYIGAKASYTVWDFGSSKHKEKQGELGIDNSQLDFLIEEREVMASTVESVVKISSLVENSRLLRESIASISKLSGFADVRFNAGVSSVSESNTLNLRLAELKSELEAINIEIALNLDLLSAKLMSPITLNDIPSLYSITSQILPDLGNESLQLRQAEINKEIAFAQFQQAKSDIYPHLVLDGEVGKATNGNSIRNVGVSFQLPTSVFARSATVNAAESAYKATERKVTQIQTQLNNENKRIELETNRLNNNKNTLIGLEKKGVSAIKVFGSEFEAGSATLSDGLSAYRTLLQTRQQLISLQAQLLNLKASKIRITNGSIFNISE